METLAMLLALWLGMWHTPAPAEDDQLVSRLTNLSQAVLWYRCQCAVEPIYERYSSAVWVGATTVEEGLAAGFYFSNGAVTWEVHEP